jgi:hypothetical protein
MTNVYRDLADDLDAGRITAGAANEVDALPPRARVHLPT